MEKRITFKNAEANEYIVAFPNGTKVTENWADLISVTEPGGTTVLYLNGVIQAIVPAGTGIVFIKPKPLTDAQKRIFEG